jgi:hypothetical protein
LRFGFGSQINPHSNKNIPTGMVNKSLFTVDVPLGSGFYYGQ